MIATKNYHVAWGGSIKTLSIPRDNLAVEMAMTNLPPVDDVWTSILAAMEDPIGCKPLSEIVRPGNKVAILTGDRITDRLLGASGGLGMRLLDFLNLLGVRDDNVTLIYAGGAHSNLDWRNRLGPELLSRIRAIKHDAWDDAEMTYVGMTSRCTPVWVNRMVVEADVRLAFGEISPSVHGGWCGGGKIILPGVAGIDTIQQNHHYLMRDLNPVGLADGNPMRLDMEEAAGLANLTMKVDILVDVDARVVGVFAGDFVAEHRAALPTARRIWMTPMEPVDIIVVYPGEWMETILSPSMWIRLEGSDIGLKKDGILIMALSAATGWDSPDRLCEGMGAPADILKLSTTQLARSLVRKEGNVRNSSMMYSAKRVLEQRRSFLVCDGIRPDDARAFGFAHCTTNFDEALAMALAERGRDATIATNIQTRWGWRVLPWRDG